MRSRDIFSKTYYFENLLPANQLQPQENSFAELVKCGEILNGLECFHRPVIILGVGSAS